MNDHHDPIEPDPRRVHRRERTLAKAKIFHGPDLLELNCTVTDRSEGGARVRIPPGMFLPGEVWLLDVRLDLVSRSTVAWRNYPLIGLTFEDTFSAERGSTPQERIFRRAWLAAKV